MGSLYKLITKTNLKSPVIAFPLVFPLILLLMYSVMIGNDLPKEEVDSAVNVMFITAISLTTMQSGLMGFGFTFIKLKKSVMLRRIGATKLKKEEVLGAIILYGLTIWVISIVWLTTWAYIFSASHLFFSIQTGSNNVDHIYGYLNLGALNWPMFLAGAISMLMISYAIGLLFSTFAKDDSVYHAMTMTYFFTVGLIGGLMVPGQKPEWMINVAYVLPNSYPNELFGIASGSVVIGDLPPSPFFQGYAISEGKAIADFIVPIILSIIIFVWSVKILKFD